MIEVKNFLLASYIRIPSLENSPTLHDEIQSIASLLQNVVPLQQGHSYPAFFDWIKNSLPFVTWKLGFSSSDRHIVYFVCFSDQPSHPEEFFKKMLKEHLRSEIPFFSLSSSRFYFDGVERELLLIEASLVMKDKQSLWDLEFQLGTLSKKAISDFSFSHPNQRSGHAWMKRKEEKIFQIQQKLIWLVEQFPEDFDNDLLTEWKIFLSLATTSFYDSHLPKHLCRIAVFHYLQCKNIKRASLINSEKRHVQLRFLPTKLHSAFGHKMIYGVLVTLSFLNKYEYFDEEHLLAAMQKWMPEISLVPGSRYLFHDPHDGKICTLYVEIEQKGDKAFTLQQRKHLLKVLPEELKERVQRLVPLLFTVRNEEQIMKNIIILGRELTDLHSLPQMMITFEKQTETALIFTVILAHLPIPDNLEIRLYQSNPSIEITLERRVVIGYMKDGCPKEASIFRFQVAKSAQMFRKDFSVDVYHVRQKIYEIICDTLGEVRDYDGGLLIKQKELFSKFKGQFSDIAKEDNELLENFFYSITPIEQQATLPLDVLSHLFSLVLSKRGKSVTKKGAYIINSLEENNRLFVFIRAEHVSVKNHLQIKKDFLATFLIKSSFYIQGSYAIGYILECAEQKQREHFLQTIRESLQQWQRERIAFQVLRLNFIDPPLSLDPRRAGDELSKTILQMMYEGLMRVGSEEKPEPAIAESFVLSSDLKKYVFHLKKCLWSNGDPVTAFDFEYAWKMILQSNFKTFFAHFFYPIKNARKAKNGNCSLDEVGIKALDDYTLQVDLEYPVPYFLELIALPLFSPVHAATDRLNPHLDNRNAFICNGPFSLKKNLGNDGYILEKNLFYHKSSKVHLREVVFTRTNIRTALEMFKNDELHWLGRPLYPWRSFFEQAKTDSTTAIRMFGTVYWCSLNVRSFPFQNLKLRQALSLAINRQEIINILQDGDPAFSPLPLMQTSIASQEKREGDGELAKILFDKALQELNLTAATFPCLSMIYPDTEKRRKISQIIQLQWKKHLGIDVVIKAYDWPSLFQKISAGNYQIAGIAWYSLVSDPLYTLNAFKHAEDCLNFPKWEKDQFQELLNLAVCEKDAIRKKEYTNQAEALLIKETPVIPILYERCKGLKKNSLQVKINAESVDFNFAFF